MQIKPETVQTRGNYRPLFADLVTLTTTDGTIHRDVIRTTEGRLLARSTRWCNRRGRHVPLTHPLTRAEADRLSEELREIDQAAGCA